MFSSGPRIHEQELIDRGGHDLEELARSLRHVARVDRLLGGARALRGKLAKHVRRAAAADATLTILDVGTGNGDVAADLQAWAEAKGAPCRITGLDSHGDVVRVATREVQRRGGGPLLVQGDALALPFADDAFDVACCTLTLHHFSDTDAARLVAEMARVGRYGAIVNDLERTPLNYWAALALSWTWWRGNRLTRHDGPLSVLRSFTSAELEQIGKSAGLEPAVVNRRFPFRLLLEGRCAARASPPPDSPARRRDGMSS